MKFLYKDVEYEDGGGTSGGQWSRPCRYCHAPTATAENSYTCYGEPWHLYYGLCLRCGWWEVYFDDTGWEEPGSTSWYRGILLELDTDEQLDFGLTLLTNELARQPERLYELHPRQFELLVASLYRNLFNCSVELTKYTKDGGKDLVCFDSDRRKFVIEVKRYSQRRRIDVRLVRQLLGVMLTEGVQRGVIVTTSSFTRDAMSLQRKISQRDLWRIDCKDFVDVADWLKLAHDDYLNVTALDEIIRRHVFMAPEIPRGFRFGGKTVPLRMLEAPS